MSNYKTLEETYDSCVSDGYVENITGIDINRLKGLYENAKTNINSANIIIKSIYKDSKEWLNVYTLHYEALRMLTESFLLFDKISSTNHKCLFATLCVRYPELELDWNFFEKIITKMDNINHEDEQITHKDWKEIELQMKIYISTITKEIEKKLK